jgi:hypothetical protein
MEATEVTEEAGGEQNGATVLSDEAGEEIEEA